MKRDTPVLRKALSVLLALSLAPAFPAPAMAGEPPAEAAPEEAPPEEAAPPADEDVEETAPEAPEPENPPAPGPEAPEPESGPEPQEPIALSPAPTDPVPAAKGVEELAAAPAPNDAPDKSPRLGVTLRRADAYAQPADGLARADYFWDGVYLYFSPWDAAGEWLSVAWEGRTLYVRAADVSLRDAPGAAARVGTTLRRTSMYLVPEAADANYFDFFWDGVSYSFAPWDAAGEWLVADYAGRRVFVAAADVAFAAAPAPNDAPDKSPRLGVTLRRADAYAQPADGLARADYFWDGVYLYFSPWDAAGEWLSVAWEGRTLYVRAADVSLRDAPGAAARVGTTLRRTSMYLVPEAADANYFDFFWDGVSYSFAPWDAAGEWLVADYAGRRVFVAAADVVSAAPGDSGDGTAYLGLTLRRAEMYKLAAEEADAGDFFWGGVGLTFTRWDAAGEWLATEYGGSRVFVRASDVSLQDAYNRGIGLRGSTLRRTSMYSLPEAADANYVDFFWDGVSWDFRQWDRDGAWLTTEYGGRRVFVECKDVKLDFGLSTTTIYPISLSRLVDLQAAKGYVPRSELEKCMNPALFPPNSSGAYQFVLLTSYSGSSGAQLDRALDGAGVLSGQGDAFVAAAQRYGINEVYFAAHTILETGWGSSTLAKGQYYDGGDLLDNKGKLLLEAGSYPAGWYYNLFGIGAYDYDPNTCGLAMAVKQGWSSVAKAVDGSASWINDGYLRSSWHQDTLYEMLWQPAYAVQYGVAGWHQYATDPGWAKKIADCMATVIAEGGCSPSFSYDVPAYLG